MADRRRFESLLTEEVYQSAWRYALRLCANRIEAEDLLHDALAAALLSVCRLREDVRFKCWLLSILRNRFIDSVRRRRFEPDLNGRPAEAAFAARAADRDSLVVLEYMQQLNSEQQEILGLFYFEDLALAEIASVMGVAEGGVRQRLMRARRALRRKLEQSGLAYRPTERGGGDKNGP